MNSRPTQSMRILEMMKTQWVSPLDALRELGCMRLGARVYELRQDGVEIEERWADELNRWGERVRFKEFRLRRNELELF